MDNGHAELPNHLQVVDYPTSYVRLPEGILENKQTIIVRCFLPLDLSASMAVDACLKGLKRSADAKNLAQHMS